MLAVPAEVRIWDPPGPPTYTAAVSRTVQSTDLFCPYDDPRVTLPSIAEQQRAVPALGGKHWGEKLTEYGGIGGFPFLGHNKVRDLSVSRSHRHFGSGVTKPATYEQPYQLTFLNKSGCRINDERLSAPMTTNLGSIPQQQARWPDNHRYNTHRSRFEVFPDVRPQQRTDQTSDGRSTKSTNSYDDALWRLHHKLFNKSLYQDSYRGHFHDTKPALNQTNVKHGKAEAQLEPSSWKQGGLKDEISEENEREDQEVFKKDNDADDRNENQEERNEEEGEEDVEGKERNKEDNDEGGIEDTSSQGEESGPRSILVTESIKSGGSSKRCVSFSQTPQVMILESREKYLDRKGILDNDPIGAILDTSESSSHLSSSPAASYPGTGPYWPPSTSLVIENIRGSQLLERRDIAPPIGHPPSLPQAKRCPQPLEPAGYRGSQSNQPFVVPSSYQVNNLTKPSETFGVTLLEVRRSSPNPGRKLQDELARRIAMRKGAGATPLFLPPVPLSECLTPSGSKTPHMLGLRFKTEAHRRYHTMHPEQTPDLRSTRHSGKKYFFRGDHSSVFR